MSEPQSQRRKCKESIPPCGPAQCENGHWLGSKHHPVGAEQPPATDEDEPDTSCSHPYPQMGCPDCGLWFPTGDRVRGSQPQLSDLLEWAWTIIANAGGGDWERESKDWQDAAAKWRDTYYGSLKGSHAEWTENERGLVIGDQVIALSHDKVKLILDAYNDALAAEQEKHAETKRQLGMMVDWRDQLAATKQQLLSAQAAIAEVAQLITEIDGGKLTFDHAKVLHRIRTTVDLSALDKHDEAVRKPLVDALQLLVDNQNGCPLPKYEKDWNKAMQLAADALAKVK